MPTIQVHNDYRYVNYGNGYLAFTTQDSTAVSVICYFTSTKSLRVTYRNGSEYKYEEVPYEIAVGLLLAESVGKALHETVKMAGYNCRKVEEVSA